MNDENGKAEQKLNEQRIELAILRERCNHLKIWRGVASLLTIILLVPSVAIALKLLLSLWPKGGH